jgi:uncharacterized membrane protein
MTIITPRPARMERALASMLHHGTWVASLVIALGLASTMFHGLDAQGLEIVTCGIGLLIFLPVLRVGLMFVMFVREKDYRFGAISLTVLLIILAGYVLGMVVKS